MKNQNIFNGFQKETINFFRELKKNNSKSWFEANRHIYDKNVLQPAQAFIVDMGKRLEKIIPDIVAIPKVDQSIFRIYRDIRFSPNKIPYKTHLGIFFWEGSRKKLDNPGFYLQIDNKNLLIGVGMYEFSKPFLDEYRKSVVHPKYGKELVHIIDRVTKNPENILGGKFFKKTPRGYDADHPYAELLLHKGMGFHFESPLPKEIFSSSFIDYVYIKFEEFSPIHFWLREMSKRVDFN